MKAGSNSGGVKNMLLQHVEKIVLGVAVILVALFLWSAMGVQPIDESKHPEKLLAAATTEKQRIQESQPPAERLDAPVDFEKAVVTGLEEVLVTPYVHPQQFSPPIQPPIVKRPEPTLLPVEDIRATATVISIAELGTPPVWKDPEKVKAAKKEAKPRPRARQDRRRGGRGQAGYGGAPTQPGYGQSAPASPGYGQTGGDRAAADRSPPGAAGYGGGPQGGYGGAGYGTSSDTGPGSHGGAGYGGAGGGYGGVPGMSGERPGVSLVGQQAEGVVYPAVVLTGRVPYEKQFDEFQKKFKGTVPLGAPSAAQDEPIYMQFKIERQEVTPSGDGKWVAVDLDEAIENETRWLMQAQEFVDPAYLDPVLAWPLAPTIQRDWGRLASHPSIPFTWMAEETVLTAITPTVDGGMLKQERTRTAQPQGHGYGIPGYSDGPVRGGYGGVMGAADGLQPLVAKTPYLLFRFVDTQKIEPGKEYRYRVALEVQNPNYLAPPAILEDPASSQQVSRWTPPTESPSVTVPGKSFLYALSSKSKKGAGDQSGEVLFHVWNEKMGAEVAKEFELELGAIADFIDDVEDWYNPYTGAGEKLDKVHFQFQDGPPMLADITGGVEVPGFRDLDQPTEMLFIDAQGRLFTSNQARGSAAAEFYKNRYSMKPAADVEGAPFGPQDGGLLQPPGGYGGGAPR